MQLGKSDLFTLIYAQAESLRKTYRSSNLSQTHLLCALLSTALHGEPAITAHAELLDSRMNLCWKRRWRLSRPSRSRPTRK